MWGLMTRLAAPIALALLGVLVGHAQEPARPRLAGFTVTTEGGVEGKQVIRYDENGRPIDGNVPLPPQRTAGPAPRPTGPSASVQPTEAPRPAALQRSEAAPVSRSLMTEDGRKLPFTMEGRNPASSKRTDGSVDFDASLRKVGKESDLARKRFDTEVAPIGKGKVYSRENLMTLETWHGRYDTYGRRKADLVVEDTLGAGVRPKDMLEVKSIERRTAAVSGSMATIRGVDARMTTERASAYDVRPSSPSDRAAPKSIDQLSMQDINRYQFRRNRSDEPGLPVVKPGSDQVQTKGSGAR